ncbi:MAG: hypothetical protein APG12_00222 [Candidatus Methanofastidiosum methylothiophilum]|uniref:Uncharacterized protein n=1 Tax=Candidatus Methanofastidiosum methylothiophilum TaxID=1705564 RepID=A0A150IJU8_9EURY|nr:MAG: hypothetical protein APG10_01170 [Candidatus Methanofastidiosum methylthiophilus]KYC48533.1 MAG: hypothetical protein APG11_00204 [Candidatus Methanofastidiosum methylthiophilus]KYC51297.1 MAG: hypothetical protein APG12_00222 [Candidatus Methanofastidiosum methylthiophilus]
MIFGLPETTFYVVLIVPIVIALLLLFWGFKYNPEEEE